MTKHHKLSILKHLTFIILHYLRVTHLDVANLGLRQDVTQDWVLIWGLTVEGQIPTHTGYSQYSFCCT